MQVRFTKLSGTRYSIDVAREFDPPARMHVAPKPGEPLPHNLAHLIVEREFRLPLGIFGQLAAGGDAGTFWCAPADRSARLAQRAHRLRIAGRGDLGRSERLVTVCVAAWEIEAGRRVAGEAPNARALYDTTRVSQGQISRAVEVFADAARRWGTLEAGQSLCFDWPGELTLRATARLRSA